VFHKIKTGKFHFDHVEFKECSKDVLDLIRKLLTVDSTKRLSASQALKHPWFNKQTEH
jgi:calcium-dependent protein kinase